MKRIILFIIVIYTSLMVFGQVGINTENPQSQFHIDAANNSGTTTDDVILRDNGRLGIGTTSPTAKVHVSVPNGNTALRINDGTESDGRVLMSDANGNAKWGVIKGSGGSTINIDKPASYPTKTTSVLKLNGDNDLIPIVSAGNYLITIRWWGRTSVISSYGTVSAYFYLYRNGVEVDGIEYYVPAVANVAYTFTTVLLAIGCQDGDNLQIRISPSIGGQPWTVNNAGDRNPTIAIFRM